MTLEERVELLAIDRYLAERNRPAAVEDDEAAAQARRADFLSRLAAERRKLGHVAGEA